MTMVTIRKIVTRASRLETEFPTDSIWRHHTSRLYKIVGVANIANWNPKYRPVIVYRSVSPTPNAILPSRLWTKTPADFRKKLTRIAN